MKISLFIIGLLIIFVAVFEFHPAVKGAQSYVSVENYKDSEASCQVLLAERPWYGKLNYWFYAWLMFVPMAIFSVSPASSVWMRGGRVLIAAGVCYVLMNLAVHLHWDIRNAPFQEDPFNPDPLNGWRMDCADYSGDGLSYIIAFYTGWIPGCIYTCLWIGIWIFYHRRILKDIKENYKNDFTTKMLIGGLKIYGLLLFLFILAIVINAIGYFFLNDVIYNPKWLFFPYYLVVRPLIVPFEIFTY